MELGYCLDCKELNFALTNRNGEFSRANMSNNHFGHRQYVFDRPGMYSPPIRNVLTKLQALAPISDNEITLFKLAIALGDLDGFCEGISDTIDMPQAEQPVQKDSETQMQLFAKPIRVCSNCAHADYSGLTSRAETSRSVCGLDGHRIAFFTTCEGWAPK